MKLHLPKQLFTALLAAIAFAAPAALTIGSASSAITLSENTAITVNGTTHNATIVSGVNNTGMNMGGNITLAEGSDIIAFSLQNDQSGTAGGNNWFSGTQTYAGNILVYDDNLDDDVEKGLIINNGGGGNVITFAGSVYGNGTIHKTSGAPSNGMDFKFTGDMSAFTGDIILDGNPKDDLIITGSTTGTGIIKSTGAITFNGATVYNAEVTTTSALNIGVEGEHSITTIGRLADPENDISAIAPTVNVGSATISSGASLNILNGSLTSTGDFTNNGTLTVNSGASLVSNGTFTNAAGASITVNGNFTNSGTLVLGSTMLGTGTVTNSGDGVIKLGNYSLNNFTGVTYVNGGSSGFVNSLTVFANTSTYSGLVYVGDAAYDVTNGNITLSGADKTYYVNDDLTYNADTMGGATSYVVAEGKTLSLAGFAVAADTTVSFTFAGAGTTTLSGTLTNNGNLTINGPVTLASASTLNLAAGSNLVLNNAGTIILRNESGNTEYKKTTGTGTLTIGNGTVIELANTSRPGATGAIEGSVVVLGGGKLLLSGNSASLLGYNNNHNDTTATDNVYLLGTNAGSKATMEIISTGNQHLSTNLYLQGYAQVTGGNGTIETYHGKITATGTDNTIASQINVNRAITVEVTAENDALEISGRVHNGANPFTKTGQGSLTFTNTGTGTSSKNVHGTYTNQAGITNINAAESSFTNYTNTAGTTNIAGSASITSYTQAAGETNIKGGATIATLTQNGGGINVSSDSASIGTLSQSAGTFTLQAGAELSLGKITSAVTMDGTGTLVLKGSDNYAPGLTFTGGVTELRDFSKAVSGTLALGSVDIFGRGLYMNSDNGSITAQALGNVATGAELIYGTGSNTNYLGNLTTQVTLNFYDVADQLSSGINLGFSRGDKTLEEVKALLAVNGLESESYTLSEQNGNVYLTSTSALTSGWDDSWGGVGLAGKPTGEATVIDTLTDESKVAVNGEGTYYKLADTTAAAAELKVTNLTDAIVVGGYVTPSTKSNTVSLVERNVWIRATSGTYAGIVGGNVTENYNGGVAADFEGATHILVDGATVGSIVGGNYRDAKSPTFNGNSYISIQSGNVTGSIFGGSVNGHNGTTTFNGDTHIFVYVPLDTNNANAIDGGNLNNVIAGAGGRTRNTGGTNILNGNSHITIDLSGYTGDKTTFVKRIVGGYANWNTENYTTTINGNTGIAITGKSGVSFTEAIVGGSYTAGGGTFTITGGTDIVITSGEFSNSVVGGSYTTGAATTNTTSTKLTLKAGTYTGTIVGGDYSTSTGTKTVGATDVTISGGIYSNVVAAGSYTTGTATTNITSTGLTISDGSFSNSIVGGSYTTAASNNSVGTTNVSISGGTFGSANSTVGSLICSPYNEKPLIAGGHLLDANTAGTTMNATSTNVTITGGSIGMDIFGGHIDRISPSGSNSLTATLDSATVTLNGVNASVANIYGGSFTQRDNSNVTITQGNIVVDLIAGTVNGNVYAGGRQLHDTKITTENTEVRISDGVVFTSDSATVSGGYQIGCSDHSRNNPSTVTGTRTLVFNGASQDRSGITFDSFDTIQVTAAASTVILDTLTNASALNKTGAGTLTLNGDISAATVTSAGGNLVLNGTITGTGTYTANGGNITIGNLTVNEGVQLNLGSSGTSYVRSADGAIITNKGTISLANISYNNNNGWGDQMRQYVSMISAISGGKVKLAAHNLTLQLGNNSSQGPTSVTFNADYTNDGELRLANYDRTTNWNVSKGGAITVSGNSTLWLDHKQTLNIEGGDVSAGKVQLGYGINGNSTLNGAVINMTAGSLTTGSLLVKENAGISTALNMSDGTLTITGTNIIDSSSKGSIALNISGGTLKADTVSWVMELDSADSIGNVSFDIASEKSITLNGTINILGALTHNGSGTLAIGKETTENASDPSVTLRLTQAALQNLACKGEGVDADKNGLGHREYQMVCGTGATNYGSSITVAVSTTGSEYSSEGYEFANGIITSSDSVYVINTTKSTSEAYDDEENGISADTEFASANGYQVNSTGTFTLAGEISYTTGEGDSATTVTKSVAELLTTTTGTGTIVLNANASLTSGAASAFQGILSVGAVNLDMVGDNKQASFDLSSFASVELAGTTVNYHGRSTTLQNVTVAASGATLNIEDMYGDNGSCDVFTLAGTTQLTGDLGIASKTLVGDANSWKYIIAIEKLTGSGKLGFASSTTQGAAATVNIADLSGFTGSLQATKNLASSSALLNLNNLTGTLGLTSVTLTGGAALNLSVNENESATMSAAISGAGAVTKLGAGTLILSSESTFTGNSRIEGGTLKITNAQALGTDPTIAITGEGSVLDVAVTGDDNGALANANITMGAGVTLKNSGGNNWANNPQIHTLTLEGDAYVDVANGRLGLVNTNGRTTLNLGTNTLTKQGANSFILMGTDITGSGTFKISQGSVLVGYNGNGGATTVAGTGTVFDLCTRSKANEVILNIENIGAVLKVAGVINGAGGAINNIGKIELHGTGEYSLGATVTGGGTLKLAGAGTHTYTGSSISNAINLENAGSKLILSSDSAQSVTGTVSGAGTLEKQGEGTATLTRVDGMSGDIIVNAGELNISTATALSGSLSVSGDGSLSVGSLTTSETLTIGVDENASLSFTSVSVNPDNHNLTTEGAASITYVDDIDGATTDGNGYKSETATYILFQGYEWAGGAVDGFTLHAENGNTYLDRDITTTTYYVQKETVAYDTAAADDISGDDTTGIVLNGGNLDMQTSLNAAATNGIVANKSATINLASSAVTLEQSKLSITGDSAITLTGSGVYNLGSSSSTNVVGLNESTWTGTVKFGAAFSNLANGTLGNSLSTIEMVGASGWLSQSCDIQSILKLTKESEEKNGLTINAASDWSHTFSGKVTGNGDFTILNTNNGNPDYFFTGDLSEWSGTFRLQNTTETEVIVKMTGGGILFTAESGGISVDENGTGTLAVTIGESGKTTNMLGGISNSGSAEIKLTVGGTTTFSKGFSVQSLSAEDNTTSSILLNGGLSVAVAEGLDLSQGGDADATLKLGSQTTLTHNGTLWMSESSEILLEEGAKLATGIVTVTGLAGEAGSEINRDANSEEAADKYETSKSWYHITNADVDIATTAEGAMLGNALDNSSVTNTGNGELTVNNSGNTITSLTAEGGNVKISANMAVDSISAKSEKVVTVTSGNTINMGNGAVSIGTNGADATLTAKSDNAIAQLQEGASFTIQDMTLTNTTVTAAAPSAEVSFSNVTVNGSFVLNVAAATTMTEPTVGAGGAEGTAGTITYSYDLGLSSATAASNTITLNLDVLNAITPSQSGQYTLVVELTNFDDSEEFGSVDDATWKSLVGFQEGSWLAEAITAPTVAPDGSSTTPTVSYGYTVGGDGSNVGRLTITISGLNVPEPTTSTLSLIALAALAARRRRK